MTTVTTEARVEQPAGRPAREAEMAWLAGRHVLVVGAGASGVAAARWLAAHGATVTLADHRDDADVSPLRDVPVRLALGPHRAEVFLDADLIVMSPGVSPWLPVVHAARLQGTPVIGELELAAWFLRGRIIAVTGTKGKSTTTTLIGRMCEAAGMPTALGGNLGPPLSGQIDDSTPETIHVVEASSFQLETTDRFRPWIAAYLNFSPDHLDRHATIADYRAAKARIFANQRESDIAVVNADDPVVVRSVAGTQARVMPFSVHHGPEPGFGIVGQWIVHRRRDGTDEPLIPLSSIRLIGPHLVADVVAAAAVGWLAGVPADAMVRAVEGFTGLPHALELVGEVDGVRFVNDSKATNIDAARRSLESGESDIVAIMGGRFKGGDWRNLREAVARRVRAIVAVGESAPDVRRTFADLVPVHGASTMDEAVETAWAHVPRGGTVLLAPGCASFDMFSDYAARGRAFTQAASRLIAAGGRRA